MDNEMIEIDFVGQMQISVNRFLGANSDLGGGDKKRAGTKIRHTIRPGFEPVDGILRRGGDGGGRRSYLLDHQISGEHRCCLDCAQRVGVEGVY